MTSRRLLATDAAAVLVVAAAAIAIAVWLTPMQQVSAAGQDIEVGVGGPSMSMSGPGELDLFGQRIPTTVDFVGPFRPRLRLTHVSLSDQLAEMTSQGRSRAAPALQSALARGWKQYFLWEVLVTGLVAIVLAGAVTGWLRRPMRRAAVVIGITVAVAEVVNLGGIMVTAYTAPKRLRTIRSLQALVGGSAPPDVVARSATAPASPLRIVVIGDSTAAGQGDAPLLRPTADDRACHRSSEAYAVALGRAPGRAVVNLACGGASIRAGLLGEQRVGGRIEQPQLGSPSVRAADVVFISVGANDVHWADMLRVCAVSHSCTNNAAQAYLQQQLSGFSRDYLQLISQLQLLPKHPKVVVNRYFDPFAGSIDCLSRVGMTELKRRALELDLAALNEILVSGAKAAGFSTATPDFSGHGICSRYPYVQGLNAGAPFHPTATGELAIALADERAMQHLVGPQAH